MPVPLAKSAGEEPIPLSDHLLEVANYASSLVSAYRVHLSQILGDELVKRVEKGLRLAALIHDLGKAAKGFQNALQGGARWKFRHEVISAALLLTMGDADDVMRLALAAVITHHRDVDDTQLRNDAVCPAIPEPTIVDEAAKKFSRKADEMQDYWEWLEAFLAECAPLRSLHLPESPKVLLPPAGLLEQVMQESEAVSPFDSQCVMALILTRGWLMAADHAVSAGVKRFQRKLPEPTHLPALRPFQQRLAEHYGDAFLEAPTGSGKTIAALLWALRNRRGGERIFYMLPYQASIEAMKNTLSDLLGKQYVAALHARAVDYAFRDYFENTGEYEAARQQAEAETGLNRLVHKSLKVTTPFQLLKWFFGIPRFEIGVSEMLGGLFIFDEIHTYDAHTVALISEMVRVLKRLGGRCLFMSATFPLFMKTLLGDAVGEEPAEFSLDEDQSDDWTRHFLSLARHRLRWHDVPLESLSSQVVRAAQNGKRVLVVANRVAQAQEIYRAIRGEFPDAALLHSRFTRRDRTEEEKRIIGTFRGEYDEELKALVATQVVEVSLDVSFDTIFTEVAPVDDLLQRFGRVNRYGEHPDGVEVHVARRFDNDRLRWVYDLARLQQTLEDAPDDGTPLTVELASEWTRKVYQGGWTEKESKRFDNAKVSFQSVVKSLRPLRRNPEGSDDFRGLFQSVEVLPRALFMEYDEHISNKHYLLAMQLLVPISLGTFHALRNAGGLTFIESGVWIADALYDDELGLIPEDTDTDDNII